MSEDILKVIIDKVDKLDTKIDGIAEDIVTLKLTATKHNETLVYHVKRSDLNEANIELLRKEVEPIKAHVHQVNGILKFLGIFATVGSAIVGILKILKIF